MRRQGRGPRPTHNDDRCRHRPSKCAAMLDIMVVLSFVVLIGLWVVTIIALVRGSRPDDDDGRKGDDGGGSGDDGGDDFVLRA